MSRERESCRTKRSEVDHRRRRRSCSAILDRVVHHKTTEDRCQGMKIVVRQDKRRIGSHRRRMRADHQGMTIAGRQRRRTEDRLGKTIGVHQGKRTGWGLVRLGSTTLLFGNSLSDVVVKCVRWWWGGRDATSWRSGGATYGLTAK